jgi:hypothetical protein
LHAKEIVHWGLVPNYVLAIELGQLSEPEAVLLKRLGNQIRRLSLVAALLAGSLPVSALAANYRAALAQGVDSRDRAEETGNPEDWREALQAFEEAAQLDATKEAKFELASAAAHLQLDDEACAAYADSLKLGLEGKAAELARSFIDAHQAVLAHLNVAGPAGTVVHVGSRQRATLPLTEPLLVIAGVIHVRLDAPDFQPWEGDLALTPSETRSLQPTLVPLPAVVPTPSPAPRPIRSRAALASTHAPSSGKAWGTAALIAGSTLAALGSATIVVTSELLSSERATLKQNCTVLQGAQCLRTTREQQNAAQTAADHIQTNQVVRWVAVGGAVVGVGAIAAGLLRTVSNRRGADTPHAELQISPKQIALEFGTRF